MGPEAKLYQKIRKNSKGISWNRLENRSLSGTPDLLGYNTSGTFFTVELKVTKGKKLKFSPHQIAFHVKHPRNTFIIAQASGLGLPKLFQYPCTMVRGSGNSQSEAWGLRLVAWGLRLLSIISCQYDKLSQVLGAWCLCQ